jgi:hypothetical protein
MVYPEEAMRSTGSGQESTEDEMMTVYDSSLAAAEAAAELTTNTGSDSASPGGAPESPLADGVGPWNVHLMEQSSAQPWKVYSPPRRWENGTDSPKKGQEGQEGRQEEEQDGWQQQEFDSAV